MKKELKTELDKEIIYLNHASSAPLVNWTKDGILDFMSKWAGGDFRLYPSIRDSLKRLKEHYASFIDCEKDYLYLGQSVSSLLSMIAQNLAIDEDEDVLVFDQSYPSVSLPFLKLKEKGQPVRVLSLDLLYGDLEALKKQGIEKARVMVVSWVNYISGRRIDLKRLSEFCRANKIRLIVDGTQGIGVIPFSFKELPIDCLVCSGYKWLMWPIGMSMMACSKDFWQNLETPSAGTQSIENPYHYAESNFELISSDQRFETGGLPFMEMAAANAVMTNLLNEDVYDLNQRIKTKKHFLIEELNNLGADFLYRDDGTIVSGILSFRFGKKTEQLAQKLAEKKLILTYRLNWIRVSIQFYSKEEDLRSFIKIVRETLKELS